jgi:hypothetical protein
MDRKKELKQLYKTTKHPMGVFMIKSKRNGKCHVQAAPDLRAGMNGAKARLNGGVHPVTELQKEWKQFGSDSFAVEVLEELCYSPDASKTDYTEELDFLKALWEERLVSSGHAVYLKKDLNP